MSKMSELDITIREAAEHYYKGTPTLTDTEFDKLIKKLPKNHPILKTVGWGYMPDSGEKKIRHIGENVGSLNKVKLYDAVRESKIFKQYDISYYYVLMPKLDGNSIIAHYINGLLNTIVTRGDGIYGIDVTKNLYDNLPHKIDNKKCKFLAIRGEAIITDEDFENMKGSNSRNKCAGLIQSKHGNKEDLLKIKFIPYSIVTSSSTSVDFLETKMNQLEFFKQNNFEIIPYINISSYDAYDNYFNQEYVPNTLRILLDGKKCPVDGIVVSSNISSVIEILHEDSNKPYYSYTTESVAFKYKDKSVKTVVEEINWSMSLGNKYIPVLKIREINIDGVNINNVTVNNYQWLSNNKCGIGAEVEIIRANECIPNMHMVISDSENYNAPIDCKICKSKLVIRGVDLVCNNKDCPNRDLSLIYKIWNFIKPDGASDACFDIFLKWIKECSGKNIIEQTYNLLYHTDKNIVDNHYYRLVQEAIDNYHNKKISIPDIIKMSNIPTLGRRIGEQIASCIGIENFINIINSDEEFNSDVFKFKVLNETKDTIRKVLKIWDKKFQMEEESDNHIVKYNVAVTGALSKPRNKWFNEMTQYGITKSSVNKTCNFLVCNSSSTSSTYKKAETLGIPILTENEFLSKIKMQ